MTINIIFVLGPSGVGKSELSKALAKKLDFDFYEIDQWPEADGVDAHGLRDAWDEFMQSGRADALVDLLRRRAQAAGKNGVVLSFPSMLILKGPHLRALEGKVRVLYLTGSEQQCRDAFIAREQQTGRRLDGVHWDRNNKAMFDFLRTPEARPHIVGAFDEKCRRPTEQVLAEMVSCR